MNPQINSGTLQWVYVSVARVSFCECCSWKIDGDVSREEKRSCCFVDCKNCPLCESLCDVFIFKHFPEWIVKNDEEFYNITSLGTYFSRFNSESHFTASVDQVCNFLEENCPESANFAKWQLSIEKYKEWRKSWKDKKSSIKSTPSVRIKKFREFEQEQKTIDEAKTVKRKLRF